MSTFLVWVSLLLLILFVVGIIKPKTILWAKQRTRKKAVLYLIGFIVFSVASAALSPETAKTSAKKPPLTSLTQQVQNNTPNTEIGTEDKNTEDLKEPDPTASSTPLVPSTTSTETAQNKSEDGLDLKISKPNTNEAVDYIARKAKEDAKTATNEQIKEATDYIVSALTDLTKDNDTMEHVMYYGKLIQYSCEDSNKILSGIGMDAEQAVKYQYRGYNTEAEKTATAENIRQILKGFEKLNNKK